MASTIANARPAPGMIDSRIAGHTPDQADQGQCDQRTPRAEVVQARTVFGERHQRRSLNAPR
jgi:hypothetical protein